MTEIDWHEVLKWSDEQLDDLRFTAYSYIRQGKYDIALPIFEGLVVLNPEGAYDLQTLGALYLEMNKLEEAKKTFEKALHLEGDHAPTLLNLCKTLFLLPDQEEALRLAHLLETDTNPLIANTAKALILAYE